MREERRDQPFDFLDATITFGTVVWAEPRSNVAMMDLSQKARRFLRLAGILTWVLAGLPLLRFLWVNPGYLTNHTYYLWLSFFIAFGITFVATPWKSASAQPHSLAVVLVGVQTVLAMVMIRLVCSGFEGALLVLVSLQLGWMLTVPVALAWLVLQSLLMGWLISLSFPMDTTLTLLGTYAGFEALALFSSNFAADESRARSVLAMTNAELKATQELLSESSRIAERQRISRELHDVLGHNLTALSLNLEVVAHTGDAQTRERVATARDLTKKLLADVRGVVSSVRGTDHISLERSLSRLTEAVPTPKIHMILPDDLGIDDPLRAHTLLRCTQEIITNTIRHAEARNLWIEFVKSPSGVEVLAHDDGRGARFLRLGNGLKGMQERLEHFGGQLRIESNLSKGFKLHAWMPLKEIRP